MNPAEQVALCSRSQPQPNSHAWNFTNAQHSSLRPLESQPLWFAQLNLLFNKMAVKKKRPQIPGKAEQVCSTMYSPKLAKLCMLPA